MKQDMFLFRTKLSVLIMALPVTHEGLEKPATLDLILITPIEIAELKRNIRCKILRHYLSR